VNPTLTIIANALRVGDHIAERIGTTRHAQPGTVPAPSPPTPGAL
jgi:choline dehydrogenase-like flavoprotein